MAKKTSYGSTQVCVYSDICWNQYSDYFAAGALLVQEAGGTVTDLFGRAIDFRELRLRRYHGLVASNGHSHDRLCEAIRRVLDPPAKNFRVSIPSLFADVSSIRSALAQEFDIEPGKIIIRPLEE